MIKNFMSVKFNINYEIHEFEGDRNELLSEGGDLYDFINEVGFKNANEYLTKYDSDLKDAKWFETCSEFINRVGPDHPYTKEAIYTISLKLALNNLRIYSNELYLDDEESKLMSLCNEVGQIYGEIINKVSENIRDISNVLITNEIENLKYKNKVREWNAAFEDETGCIVLND